MDEKKRAIGLSETRSSATAADETVAVASRISSLSALQRPAAVPASVLASLTDANTCKRRRRFTAQAQSALVFLPLRDGWNIVRGRLDRI